MSKSAFNAKRRETFLFPPNKLILITDELHPLYDARVHLPVNESLVRNILVYGVIKPVVITKDTEGRPIVVDGRQRTKAALDADRRSQEAGGIPILVPCVYRTGTEVDLSGILISANSHTREDDPVEKAAKANRMINLGASMDDVSMAFGVTSQTIRNWLKLLELPREDRDSVTAGEKTITESIKKQRQRDDSKPRLRKKKEIEEMAKKIVNDTTDENLKLSNIRLEVLEWVLGIMESLDVE